MSSFPLVLFAFNRPQHVRRTLDALAANVGASETDLVVFCDGPRTDAERPLTEEVRAICKQVRGFKSTDIIEREENQGLARSIRRGVTKVLDHTEAVIVMEDDLVAHPSFLRFMNEALQRYGEDNRLLSVSGYLPPPWRLRKPPASNPDVWMCPRNLSFGWGTWAHRWSSVEWDLPEQDGFVDDPQQWRAFADWGGEDLPWMLVEEMMGELNSWSIRFSYAHYRSGRSALLPGGSYLRPIGFDGSGRHCLPNPSRWLESTKHARDPLSWPENPELNEALIRAMHQSFSRHHQWSIRLGITPRRAREMRRSMGASK